MKKINKTALAPLQEKPDWVGLAARLTVGLTLFISGFLKLLEPAADFAAAIEAYRILPESLLLPVAQIMPWVELFASGFLLAGYLTRWSAAVCGILSSSFFLALASTLLRGVKIGECGCFGGAGPHLVAWQAMIIDAVLISLAHFIFSRRNSSFSLDRWIASGK
ncbi:MAG: MauE/DoxX family redox-associated membrane protein [Elusimicrobiota bacterium]